jgi:phosphomannomutase
MWQIQQTVNRFLNKYIFQENRQIEVAFILSKSYNKELYFHEKHKRGKMTLYIFDMDGTITPARLPMTKAFAQRFEDWCASHSTFIATGSDFKKVQEQLSPAVINAFKGIYCSMGNILLSKGVEIYRHDFTPPPEMLKKLEEFRSSTLYPYTLFENYIEIRTGMINFSVLGRNCPYEEREKYAAWDKEHFERLKIKQELDLMFPDYDFAVGGTISIDITPKGKGKGQIAAHLRSCYPDDEIIFFGDKTSLGGNDYELAQALLRLSNTQVVQVSGPDEVLQYLKL